MAGLTVQKKILFSGITGLIVGIALAGAELLLRASMPTVQESIVSTVAYDGIQWHKLNRSFLKQYFSSSDVLIPEFKEEQFRVTRTKNSFRIFCLGESSMFGVPYQITATIPALVRKQLRHLYPDREIEVINAGASAINSSVILDLAREVSALEPDLVLVYLGHNEFYGPEGVGASWLEKKLPFVTNIKRSAKNLALVRAVDSLLSPKAKESVRDLTLMQQVSNDTRVPLASADAERVFSNYESNIRAMIALLQEKRIQVIFSNAASNLAFPPFEFEQPEGISEKEITSAFDQGDYTSLQQRLASLLKKDSTNALVNYWMGRTLARLGRFEEAKQHLIRAKDEDLLKFRAPERTNEILRSVCAEQHVPFIDADSLLRALSPHGISDTTYFWEHVHPNAHGYYRIASQFVQAMQDFNLLPPSPHPAGRQLLPFNRDSLSICFIDLAYGDRSIRNLTSHWPFRNYLVTPAVMQTADETLRGIVENMYRSVYVWDEGCYRSAEYFERTGHMREAQTTYEAVLEEYPYNFYAHYLLGNLFNRIGKPTEALRHFEVSLRSNPTYTRARVERGLTMVNFGRFDEALAEFDEALKRNGSIESTNAASIYYGKAVVYANRKDFSAALRNVDEALRLAPGYASAIQLRGGIRAAAGAK